MINKINIEKISKLMRYHIIASTTKAGSGHPTSSLSGVELLSTLFFGGFFRFNIEQPLYCNNDRLIFSKGHASPLMYSLWAAAGGISNNELFTLRKLNSRLEGHPTIKFPFSEASTGSLGQGLSIGLGMALNAKFLDKLPYRTFVYLGDSEMTEGSQWEAIQIAAHYELDNLIGIIDVNGLGQRGETMYGKDPGQYVKRISSFGWETIIADGHNIQEISDAYQKAVAIKDCPVMIVAKTVKGKGVSFIEDKNGWHGKALSEEQMEQAIREIGDIDKNVKGKLLTPEITSKDSKAHKKLSIKKIFIEKKDTISTREAYGLALVNICDKYPDIAVLDAEVSNSTYAGIFGKTVPDRFFEMYVAEQNMVGTALGLSIRGKIPFVSTFAAFFSRAFDQIRMSQYSTSNIKFVGSHAGVSIGEDGASQMGLEDIAMFRTLRDCVILYPSDGISTEKLVEESAKYFGNVYIRTTRMDTPIIYEKSQEFKIGGSKVLKESAHDVITVAAAGITLHEALKAYSLLIKEGISIRIIDLYSIKPIDTKVLSRALRETKAIITVEDHYKEGGLGEAVKSEFDSFEDNRKIINLSVTKLPMSGKPFELLQYEGISADSIINEIKYIMN